MDSGQTGAGLLGKSSSLQPFRGRARGNRKKNKANQKQKKEVNTNFQVSPKKLVQPHSNHPGISQSKKQMQMCHKGKTRPRVGTVRRERVPIRPIVKVCAAYMRGQCYTSDCHFSHLIKPKRTQPCKYWIMERCTQGEKCYFSHSTPCKFFHLYNYCQLGDSCRFSHQRPLSDLSRKILIKEMKLEIPPKVIEYDLNQTKPRNQPSRLNRLIIQSVSVPEPPPDATLIQVSEIKSDNLSPPSNDTSHSERSAPAVNASTENQSGFSLSGFYKDTLSSCEINEDKAAETATKAACTALSNTEVTGELKDGAADKDRPSDCQIIRAQAGTEIEYRVHFLANCNSPDYADLREQLLPACTLIDPRLRHGPRPIRRDPMHSFP